MFGKALPHLTLADIQSFLHRELPEGITLDYKLDMIDNQKVAALACAFANTDGGFIIFGVREEDRKPVAPFEGGNLGTNAVQKIQQACRELIRPPLEPLFSPLLKNLGDPDKQFLVVGIPQSGKTPHSMTKGGCVYVKVQDHKAPLYPTLELYEQLREKRQSCLPRAEAMVKEAKTHLSVIIARTGPMVVSDTTPPYMSISLAAHRTYPNEDDIGTPQAFVAGMEDYRVFLNDPLLGGPNLPANEPYELETFARGACSVKNLDNNRGIVATVMHCGGAYVALARISAQSNTEKGYFLSTRTICGLTVALVRMALRWFVTFGCYSQLCVEVDISSAGKQYLLSYYNSLWFGPSAPSVKKVLSIAWPGSSECRMIEEKVCQDYISSFNVPDGNRVNIAIHKAQNAVTPHLW